MGNLHALVDVVMELRARGRQLKLQIIQRLMLLLDLCTLFMPCNMPWTDTMESPGHAEGAPFLSRSSRQTSQTATLCWLPLPLAPLSPWLSLLPLQRQPSFWQRRSPALPFLLWILYAIHPPTLPQIIQIGSGPSTHDMPCAGLRPCCSKQPACLSPAASPPGPTSCWRLPTARGGRPQASSGPGVWSGFSPPPDHSSCEPQVSRTGHCPDR